jgi:CubicO group peptidase (beta-lactamase class C family)
VKILDDIQSYVESCVEKYQIPAMSMAVWQSGQWYKGASGVLNSESGVEATTESAFQIGSIGKVFTATLVMQLVDEGLIELDQPIKHYLRDFHVACPVATESITVRQLLCHTSGIAGDLFPAEGAADNDLARYVDRCYLLPQAHAPGEMFSYTNSGFCILGRLVEIKSGLSWSDAIEERIVKPLGMQQVAIRPADSLRFRMAMGHERDTQNKSQWLPTSQCYFPLSGAPAGFVMAMSASDVATFALAHLNKGRTSKGVQWLSEESVKHMQTSQFRLPDSPPGFLSDWGLGWFLMSQNDNPFVFGHDGSTVGQCAMLRVVPEQELIFSVLLNVEDMSILKGLFCELMEHLAGVIYKEKEPAGSLSHPERYCGHYESLGESYDIVYEQEELLALYKIKILDGPEQRLHLKPIDENSFAIYSEDGKRLDNNLAFLKPNAQHQPSYLFSYTGRLCPRSV